MTTTKKVLIVAVTVAVLGGLGYWAYSYYDKKSLQDSSPDSINGSNDASNPPVPTEASGTKSPDTVSESTTNSSPTGKGAGVIVLTGGSTTNPELTQDQINFIVRVFQNWMDKYHPNWVKMSNGTMGNLNSKSALGYGNLGPQTKANLKKYKTDFGNFLMSIVLFDKKPNRNAIIKFFKYTSQFGI